MPWLPRPKWWLRPPSATLLLATWNLEHFSVGAANTGTVAKKVAHICETLRTLCCREGADASVVVALQEVFCTRAVPFLAAYLTETDAEGRGGSGRLWKGVTSEPLGNNPERAAFLWAGPPPPRQRVSRWGRRQGPLHADASSSFQLLSRADLDTVIRGQRQRGGDEKASGHFLRSPYYGLFRVGYANLLLVNVHLAAEAAAARCELSALHSLAAAIQQPNCRLLRRHSLGGHLRGAKPRGLVAILGDFNCPISRKAIAAAGVAAPAAPLTTPPPLRAAVSAAVASHAGGGGGSSASGTAPTAGHGSRRQGPLGEGREPLDKKQQRDYELSTQPQGNRQANGHADGHVNGNSGYGGVNGASWETFLSNGWVNALNGDAANNHRTTNGAGLPIATNWRAKELKSLDAICLPQTHGSLVTGCGVCAPPQYVDASQPGQYPNHLLCWVRLDLGPLQMAPGKVRPLLPPTRLAAAQPADAAVGGGV